MVCCSNTMLATGTIISASLLLLPVPMVCSLGFSPHFVLASGYSVLVTARDAQINHSVLLQTWRLSISKIESLIHLVDILRIYRLCPSTMYLIVPPRLNTRETFYEANVQQCCLPHHRVFITATASGSVAFPISHSHSNSSPFTGSQISLYTRCP